MCDPHPHADQMHSFPWVPTTELKLCRTRLQHFLTAGVVPTQLEGSDSLQSRARSGGWGLRTSVSGPGCAGCFIFVSLHHVSGLSWQVAVGHPSDISLHLRSREQSEALVLGRRGAQGPSTKRGLPGGAAEAAEELLGGCSTEEDPALRSHRCWVTESKPLCPDLRWRLLLAHDTHAWVHTLTLAAAGLPPGASSKMPGSPAS